MAIGKKKILKMLKIIEDVSHTTRMDSAVFSILAPTEFDFLPRHESQVTAFIKQRTDLWRRTWIINPLIDLHAELLKELEEIN
jgi:hypothetical protein